ncbi:MAG: hypothetical protein K6E63_11425 [Lachnospiraceae bacterium]|nr:hypothetical protein [Lachnospiraceae bacterium]
MKCKYCGYNIGLEDERCPHCGNINDEAAKHIADMKQYQEDYEQTKEAVITKTTRFNNRTSRAVIIAIMAAVAAVMLIITGRYSDIESREKIKKEKVAKEVEKNRENVTATLKEMEEHREYLAMSYYILNHQLRGDEHYSDYSRVFTAAISYRSIYDDILNIVDGYKGYEEEGPKEWCDNIAIYISDWNSYVGGEFWDDSPESSMHAGEHGAFLSDAKKATQDMVQVYFDLSDEQAASMWTMGRDEISGMLYEKCRDLYPEVNGGEE